ncbi:MAG: helix-turn-helix transcriptional regulator [Acetobacteraceae bacterium]|nr:helix-turn-helix transcriptional regulator [Acetobacteraceae bacterium]
MEVRTAALEAALDELSVGVVIATRSGRMSYANRSAEATMRMMRETKGAAAPGRRMREVIERPDSRCHAVSRGPLLRPVIVRAVPVSGRGPEQLPNSNCQVAVFLRDPDRHEGTERAELMASLGLTSREVSLAELLARDMSLAEAADALGITRESARTHLKHIFSKAGVRRQAELVNLIQRLSV